MRSFEHSLYKTMQHIVIDLNHIATILGKFGASACFAIAYVYIAELSPTLIRSTAVGLGTTASMIGGIAAPFIAGFEGFITLLVFGLCSVTGGLLAVFLPETLGAPLPHTVEQVIFHMKHIIIADECLATC